MTSWQRAIHSTLTANSLLLAGFVAVLHRRVSELNEVNSVEFDKKLKLFENKLNFGEIEFVK